MIMKHLDGDSASCAELIAILSAMSGVPVKQNFAITGSINQYGEIQPIGGANEKIEGFFKACRLLGGLKGNKKYGVVIPYQNCASLMLHRDVRNAVKDGILTIYPVRHVWEAFQFMTDHELGIREFHEENFIKGSVLEMIDQRLTKIRDENKKHKKSESDAAAETHAPAPKPTRRRAQENAKSR